MELSVTARLNVAVAPVGITRGGTRVKVVRFGTSGELPPVTGLTVAVEVLPPAVAVSVAEENRSALSKEIITDEVTIGAPLTLATPRVPLLTVAPGPPLVLGGDGGGIAIPPGVGVGVGPIGMRVGVGLGVGVEVGVGLGVGVDVGDGVGVGVRVAVAVGVTVGDGVAVGVGVDVGVAVGVGV